jgi:ABC-type multidrug transport system ATPase subunit
VLFCDEATSGLDSFTALSVIHTLRELAGIPSTSNKFIKNSSASRIVLLTIHQPTSDIFHLFTNIMLMSGGRIIFHGTVAEAEQLFTSMNLICPPRYNPAEFYVNVISDGEKRSEIVNYLASKCDKHDNAWHESSTSSERSYGDEKSFKLSFLKQCKIISHRMILNFCRDPKNYLIELLILVVSHSRSSCSYLFRMTHENN